MLTPSTVLKNIGKLEPPSMKYLADTLGALVQGKLWVKVLIGLFLGLIVGIVLGPEVGLIDPATGSMIGIWLALPGQLFLAMIQMIVIPLVIASIINGLAGSESLAQLRKMGFRVASLFFISTVLAVVVGIALASAIKPGVGLDQAKLAGNFKIALPANIAQSNLPSLSEFPQKLLSLLPSNPFSSMVENQMLEVVVFSIIVGIALLSINTQQAKPLVAILNSVQEVCMVIVRWAMTLAPFAVFGLLAQLTMKLGANVLFSMSIYVFTVLLGLLIMFVLYVLLMAIFGQVSPMRFIRSAREVLLLAFSTSSSAAVMPLSIKTAEEKLGITPSVAHFVIPLGATINMNGTALYQGVAVVFLAQAYGIDLTFGHLLILVIMSVGASIGSPATPGVAIIMLAMVLSSVGIPPAGLALIVGVDRMLDMSRTAINVSGDLLVAKLIDRWIKETPEIAT